MSFCRDVCRTFQILWQGESIHSFRCNMFEKQLPHLILSMVTQRFFGKLEIVEVGGNVFAPA